MLWKIICSGWTPLPLRLSVLDPFELTFEGGIILVLLSTSCSLAFLLSILSTSALIVRLSNDQKRLGNWNQSVIKTTRLFFPRNNGCIYKLFFSSFSCENCNKLVVTKTYSDQAHKAKSNSLLNKQPVFLHAGWLAASTAYDLHNISY